MGFLTNIDRPLNEDPYAWIRRPVVIILGVPLFIICIPLAIFAGMHGMIKDFIEDWLLKCW